MIAVIFDLDGVLVDTEPLYAMVNRRLFTKLGIELRPDEYGSFIGTPPRIMWSALKVRFELSENIESLIHTSEEAKREMLGTVTDLQPICGVPDLLQMLTAIKAELAVASSSSLSLVRWLLHRASVHKYFSVVVSGDSVPTSKPAPDIYIRAAQLLDMEPRQCIVLEDSTNGVVSAKAAGMQCIGYENSGSGPQDLSRADLRIPDFSHGSRAKILALISS